MTSSTNQRDISLFHRSELRRTLRPLSMHKPPTWARAGTNGAQQINSTPQQIIYAIPIADGPPAAPGDSDVLLRRMYAMPNRSKRAKTFTPVNPLRNGASTMQLLAGLFLQPTGTSPFKFAANHPAKPSTTDHANLISLRNRTPKRPPPRRLLAALARNPY